MLRKSHKKGLRSSLALILAVTAIVPLAVTSATAETHDLDKAIVTKNGVNYSLPMQTYREALVERYLQGSEVTFLKSSDGKVYSIQHYKEALVEAGGSPTSALALLAGTNYAKTVSTVEGSFDGNGQIIGDKLESDFEVLSID